MHIHIYRGTYSDTLRENIQREDGGAQGVMKHLRSSEGFIDSKVKSIKHERPQNPQRKACVCFSEVFNGIDFYCSMNHVKPLTGLLNRYSSKTCCES